MIQELFGSASPLIGGAGERKLISISNGIILEGTPASSSSSPSPLASPNNSSSSATAALSGTVAKTVGATAAGAGTGTGSNGTATQSSNSSDGQQPNLRCPRCDSSNTKFCYYNNYNLTQPRHFCKTCRRYWTKGGALRNVPIGGGCRKNKTSSISSSVAKSSATKFKSLSSSGFMGGLDHELPSNPVMWASPHGSHLLALLRGAPINPNPSPSPNPSPLIKEEVHMFGPHVMADSGMASACGMSPRGLGLDPLNQLPSIGLCSSFYRNYQQQSTFQQNQANHQSPQHGYMLSDAQNNSAIQALYQRLKLSTGDYDTERPPMAASSSQNLAISSAPTSSALESAPTGVGGDQLGYWSNNSSLCWSDLPTSNGAYP
ncbi:dof zinc finger protein DOF1.4-like [Punica granatum]|uniref:Dof zinc finger protein n=2 Tax=Punica granatum TaxID=22663 RepID=A0A2I0LCM0_PUNGR|nr:dof zinc finger protein DOF1.4-like [Punica granatum]PKI78430.1 hypothetical protein CRG98_001176 [Punica granatum]